MSNRPILKQPPSVTGRVGRIGRAQASRAEGHVFDSRSSQIDGLKHQIRVTTRLLRSTTSICSRVAGREFKFWSTQINVIHNLHLLLPILAIGITRIRKSLLSLVSG